MNSLILCHLICSYLTLSNQLKLPPIQSIIDNIFPNYISLEIISDNLTSTVSDHIPQFLIAPHKTCSQQKFNIFEHDWFKFNCEEFILDYFAIDLPHILKLQNKYIFPETFLTP